MLLFWSSLICNFFYGNRVAGQLPVRYELHVSSLGPMKPLAGWQAGTMAHCMVRLERWPEAQKPKTCHWTKHSLPGSICTSFSETILKASSDHTVIQHYCCFKFNAVTNAYIYCIYTYVICTLCQSPYFLTVVRGERILGLGVAGGMHQGLHHQWQSGLHPRGPSHCCNGI